MRKRMMAAGTAFLAGAALIMAVAGCGSSSTPPQAQNLLNAATSAGGGGNDSLSQQIDALKKTAMTVQIVEDGKQQGKWTQGSDGSWRWDAQDGGSNSTIIYNASKNKTWMIDGDTATESNVPASSYAGFNPAMMLAPFAYLPQTGGSGDVREYNSGGSKLTVEFKGPNGLPSKATDQEAQGKTTEWDFDYANVPDSTFDLPSGVSVQTVPSVGGGAGGATIPGGGSIPQIPGN